MMCHVVWGMYTNILEDHAASIYTNFIFATMKTSNLVLEGRASHPWTYDK
jgi:hypothetical protein